ncbi:hypothetical protein AK812_SmicGene42792, partial [Symbiodinium microadriaticum]
MLGVAGYPQMFANDFSPIARGFRLCRLETPSLGTEAHPRTVPSSTRSPGSSVSWHPLLHSASQEALSMARSASFAVPERSPVRPAEGHQTPTAGCRSPTAGHMYFPKAASFISLRTVHGENIKRLE